MWNVHTTDGFKKKRKRDDEEGSPLPVSDPSLPGPSDSPPPRSDYMNLILSSSSIDSYTKNRVI